MSISLSRCLSEHVYLTNGIGLHSLTENPAHHIYRDHLHEIDILTSAIVCIDPYVDNTNHNIDGVVDLTNTVNGNLQEQSPLKF